MARSDPPSLRKALALLRAGRGAGSRTSRRRWARVSQRHVAALLQQHPDARAGRAHSAGRGEGHRARAATARRDTTRSATTIGSSPLTTPRALEQYEKGLRLAPGDADLLVSGVGRASGLGRWDAALEHAQAGRTPRPPVGPGSRRAARRSSGCGAIPRLGRRSTGASRSRRRTSTLIQCKAMTFLGQGDLAGARAVARSRVARKSSPRRSWPTWRTTTISSGSSTRSSSSCCCA